MPTITPCNYWVISRMRTNLPGILLHTAYFITHVTNPPTLTHTHTHPRTPVYIVTELTEFTELAELTELTELTGPAAFVTSVCPVNSHDLVHS